MVGYSQDGYFFQKLSLFFQLQQLFLSTFGLESPASINISGQSCRQGSPKLIFGPTTSCMVIYGLLKNLWDSENIRRVSELMISQMLSLTLTGPQHLAASSSCPLHIVLCALRLHNQCNSGPVCLSLWTYVKCFMGVSLAE